MDQMSSYLHGVGQIFNTTIPIIFKNVTNIQIMKESLIEDGHFWGLLILLFKFPSNGKYRYNLIYTLTLFM